MLFTSHNFARFVVFFCGLTLSYSQYQPTDFNASQIINDQLFAPGRIAIDSKDNIYVTDTFQRNIKLYDDQGSYVETIATHLNPASIALNEKNDLFIADKSTGDIYKLRHGNLTLFYTGLEFPSDMAYGTNKVLYIVDSKLKKVIGLDRYANVVLEIMYSTFTFPTGIAYDPVNEHIIVSEHGGVGEDVQTCGGGGCSLCWGSTGPLTTIYIFDLAGTLQTTFGCFGTSDGLFQRIQGLAVDAMGNIFATDPYLGRVSVFDSLGTFITKFGQQGNFMGEFNLPVDIAFTSDNRILVPSMNKGSIDVFSVGPPLRPSDPVTSELNETDPEKLGTNSALATGHILIYPNPSHGEFTVRIQTEKPILEDVSIRIHTMTGQLIYSLTFDPRIEDPNNTTLYNNINIDNFSNGMYIVTIHAGSLVTQEKLVIKK